jgi:hypothetical protein
MIGTVYDLVSPVTSFVLAAAFLVVAGLAALGLAPVLRAVSDPTQAPTTVPALPLPAPPPTES